jgi:hypothetical protein
MSALCMFVFEVEFRYTLRFFALSTYLFHATEYTAVGLQSLKLIEGQPAFHFAFIPVNLSGARGEIRTLNFQILSLTPLPVGIRARIIRTIKLVLAAGFEPARTKV